jgi:hypothetical protein
LFRPALQPEIFFAFSGIIGNSATTLLTTIEEMHLLSKKIFFNSLSLHASKLMDKVCLKNAILTLCESFTFKNAVLLFLHW